MNFDFDTGLIDTIQTIDVTSLPPSGGTAGVLTINGDGAILLPQGADGARPTGVGGMFRWNTTSTLLEYFDGTTWQQLSTSSGSVTSVAISTSSGPAVTVGGGPITSTGTLTVDLSASLQAISTLGGGAGTGIVVQTGVGTFTNRTIVGTAGDISVVDGDGVSGNPTLDLVDTGTPVSASFVKITTDAKGRVTATTPVTTGDITTLVDSTYVNVAGDTMTGSLVMTTGTHITLPDAPTTGTDAANKNYVDTVAAGLSWKQAVVAASTANIDLTTGGLLTIDGVALSDGDRVLVKDQTAGIILGTDTLVGGTGYTASLTGAGPYALNGGTGSGATATFNTDGTGVVTSITIVNPGTGYSDNDVLTSSAFDTAEGGAGFSTAVNGVTIGDVENGIYIAHAGAWVRATDMDSTTPINEINGAATYVEQGTTQANTAWTQIDTVTTIGTDPIQWSQFAGMGTYTAGTGLTLTGNQFSLTSPVSVANGGTALSTTPSNGELLIGNGSGYTLAGLTAGTAISITPGAGSITINNTGVTSAVAGTGISVSASTGTVTFTNTGVTSIAGTANEIEASAATGAVTLNLPTTLIVPGTLEVTTSLTVDNLTANSMLYAGTGGLVSSTAAATNGQILIGSTGNVPVLASITAGTGISVTPGAGSISIANTGVTSVALSDGSTSPIYSISGSPVTTTGTLTFTLQTQSPNVVFAGPASGGSAQPTFRALVAADMPTNAGLELYSENPVTPTAPTATGDNSIALGSGSAATIAGSIVHASGRFATSGDAQDGTYVLRNITTTNAATELFIDGVAGTQRLVFPNNSVVTFDILIAARRTDATGGGAGYRFVGVIRKDTTAGSNTIIGSVSKTVIGETNFFWDAAVTADTTNGNLRINVTGENSKTIRWVATVRTTEVTN